MKLAQREAGFGIAPAARNLRRWTQNEITFAHFPVRDAQVPTHQRAAAPQNNVEIERPRPPTLSAPLGTSPTKAAFDSLEQAKQTRRTQFAFHHDGAVGVTPERGAYGRAVDGGGNRKDTQTFTLQLSHRRAQHRARRSHTGHAHI